MKFVMLESPKKFRGAIPGHLFFHVAVLMVITLTLFTGGAWGGAIEDLKPGEWLMLPNTNLSSVLPNPVPGGNTGPEAIMSAWSGGTYDKTRNRLMVWGGGHGDYQGNEIYAFSLSILSWTRLTNPSTCTPDAEVCTDGAPNSRHTYSSMVYAPNADIMFARGGSLWSAGTSSTHGWSFNPNNNTWTDLGTGYTAGYTVAAAYNSNDGMIYFLGYSAFDKRNPLTNVEVTVKSGAGYSAYSDMTEQGYSATVDTKRNRFVFTNNIGTGKLNYFDLKVTSPSRTQVTPTGATEIITTNSNNLVAPGLEYDPVSDRYIMWAGGANVYAVNPDTWVITKFVGAGATPTPASANGTYGRWRYIPDKNVFIGVNGVNENVYIYRLSSAASAPDPPPGYTSGINVK